jgi:hypothetical protein
MALEAAEVAVRTWVKVLLSFQSEPCLKLTINMAKSPHFKPFAAKDPQDVADPQHQNGQNLGSCDFIMFF